MKLTAALVCYIVFINRAFVYVTYNVFMNGDSVYVISNLYVNSKNSNHMYIKHMYTCIKLYNFIN